MKQALAAVAARTSLVGFVLLALFVGPSVGRLALQEGSWPARVVMVVGLAGVWCSVYAIAAVRAAQRRTRRTA